MFGSCLESAAAADRGAHAARPDGLDGFEVHERLAVVERARSSLFCASRKSRCAWTTS